MISYAAALDIVAATVQPAPPRRVPPGAAVGAVAAEDVVTSTAVPPFANAAMDGFALRSADARGATGAAPVRLTIAGRVVAGQAAPAATAAGSAWEITTGAAMPGDCDAVVPIERIAVDRGSGAITVSEALVPGQNRRCAGEDFRLGDTVITAGSVLGPAAVMGLSAVGCDSLAVRSAPRLGVIATGSELVSRGAPNTGATIRDTNGPYLAAYFAQTGMPLTGQRIVPDDPQRLVAEIGSLSSSCDMLLTTGGVSAGSLDFVPAVVERLGGEILFHRVSIRPGKPMLLARLPGGCILFGLPGNPIAVAVGLRFFVWPAVRRWMGMGSEQLVNARTETAVRRHPTLTFFAKASARVAADATLGVRLLPGQESFKIRPLLGANCWAVVPAGEGEIGPGDLIGIMPLMPDACSPY